KRRIQIPLRLARCPSRRDFIVRRSRSAHRILEREGGPHLVRAHSALEVVLFERVALGLGELAEEVAFGGLFFHCLFVVHGPYSFAARGASSSIFLRYRRRNWFLAR